MKSHFRHDAETALREQAIDARPEDPDADRDEIAETASKIEAEAAKGEQANPKKLERWLRFLTWEPCSWCT